MCLKKVASSMHRSHFTCRSVRNKQAAKQHRFVSCSQRRRGQDKTVLSRPRWRCEQAITQHRLFIVHYCCNFHDLRTPNAHRTTTDRGYQCTSIITGCSGLLVLYRTRNRQIAGSTLSRSLTYCVLAVSYTHLTLPTIYSV